MRLLFTTYATAVVACLVLTPLIRKLALRWDVVDRPDNHRKLHDRVTALGGGVAILLAFLGTVAFTLVFSRSQRATLVDDSWFLIGGASSALIICAVGLLDDRFGLRGRQKLFGQLLAAECWLVSGLWIEKLSLFGFELELGLLAVPFTLFWLLGAIYALNLLVGADGLATSVGFVLSVSIGTIAVMTGHRTEAFLALALAGALTGFLVYNRPPASIFLGDAGSMLIGLVIGMLAIRSSLKGPATVALAAPTALLAIPIFDVGMAILRRRLTGRSIYTTDRGHLHHLVHRRGFEGWSKVGVIAILCLVTSVGAVISVYMHNESLAVGATFVVFGTLVAARVFGHHELSLLDKRAKHFVRSLLPSAKRRSRQQTQLLTHVQGNRQWEELWETLTRFAERFDLSAIQLNVTMPAIEEEYHAVWKRKQHPPESTLWRSEIPLLSGKATVGRLQITGACHGDSVCVWMGELIAGLKPFESHMLEILNDEAESKRELDAEQSLELKEGVDQDNLSAQDSTNYLTQKQLFTVTELPESQ